jgi:polynucleotide kinase-phosphatase
MKLEIPELSLVALVGPSGCGKSTFAAKHFLKTEVISSDFCRGLVSDDENDQASTKDAFDVLHYIVRKRLALRRLAVVDATNVQAEARKPLVTIAREYHAVPVAIVFRLPEELCRERNGGRPDRDFGPHVVRQQHQQMRRSIRGLEREGFRYIYVLNSPEQVESVKIERQPLWTDLRHEHGPFDIIGDVHGCFDELVELLGKLEYRVDEESTDGRSFAVGHPAGRKVVFLGDLVDRGPNTPGVMRLVMSIVKSGAGLCVAGNHDVKLARALKGRNVQVTHGLAESLEQLGNESEDFKREVAEFIENLRSHYVLDEERLVVAHAGMKEEMQGRASRAVREFALFGETTGETDEFGLPVRYPWADEYRGRSMVVYGHTPVPAPEWVNHTINVDTGCVFGGALTGLRYPERELVSVPARRTYYEPARPFLAEGAAAPAPEGGRPEEVLDINDVMGKRIISTRLRKDVTVREENAAAAVEVMSRFAADPRWLIYLPPTMSPTETSTEPGLLEHPQEAFAYYRRNGVPKVICEEKHMGSRAVVIVCRDRQAARNRFGKSEPTDGIVYTRTGRPFFDDRAKQEQLLGRVRAAVDAAGLWEDLDTDWLCLDCELMPWSAKAQELLQHQYAAVGAAGRAALSEASAIIRRASKRISDLDELDERYGEKLAAIDRYTTTYREYCWPINSVDDLRLAPFHLLASERSVHVDKDHEWHMGTLARICKNDPFLLATPFETVDVTDPDSESKAIAWWEELTGRGGEGMVVKPLDFVVKGSRGLAQPAIKVRGRDYLRIIYGPEYTLSENLERLRARGLSHKRSLAVREFALGIEALERFVRREPLYRVHECVFAVLALESEPVDPRL